MYERFKYNWKTFCKKIISENDKLIKLFNLKNDEIINEEEIIPTIETTNEKEEKQISRKSIILDDQTPKRYLKTYKLEITGTTLEDQVINSRDIIKETL